MSISIVGICSAKNYEWDTIWERCEYSTYFHSREWAEIWRKYSKGKINPEPKIIKFSDGAKALLPLSYYRTLKGLQKSYLSSPAGTFGGWLSEGQLTEEHGQALYDCIFSKLGSFEWRVNPYCPVSKKINFQIFENDETHALDLNAGFDIIYKSWTKGHKSGSRKARKAGITTRKASNKEDWEKYFQIYEESLKRWGDKASSSYSWVLFEIIQNINSKNIALWLAELDEKIIAGALCFYHRNHIVYWHGAALSEYFNTRPVNLLLYDIMKDACLKEAKWFDFNPSGGHEGVKNFKKSFGTKAMPCPIITKTGTIKKIIHSFRSN